MKMKCVEAIQLCVGSQPTKCCKIWCHPKWPPVVCGTFPHKDQGDGTSVTQTTHCTSMTCFWCCNDSSEKGGLQLLACRDLCAQQLQQYCDMIIETFHTSVAQ
jgi:hypothetical protein